MYFTYYIYRGILFLSILVNANIQGIREYSLLRIMILHIQKTCGFLILKGGSFNSSI